ncbi:hypothetical protein KT99_04599 [Shewanella benthica KT99]|uniref:Uncharacterized protein n=1 Tax=Shewanella benthica KT99 TaxID=314608 RepID=A9D2S4_9GAMM|nr:hypothetical protein KT99_04599 [Shewanella benthica KT99]
MNCLGSRFQKPHSLLPADAAFLCLYDALANVEEALIQAAATTQEHRLQRADEQYIKM